MCNTGARLEQPEDLAGAGVGLKLAARERHGAIRVNGGAGRDLGFYASTLKLKPSQGRALSSQKTWLEPELASNSPRASAMVPDACGLRVLPLTNQVYADARLEQPEDLAGAGVGLKLAARERHGAGRVWS